MRTTSNRAGKEIRGVQQVDCRHDGSGPKGSVRCIYGLDGELLAEADGATGKSLRLYVWLPAEAADGGVAEAEPAAPLPLALVTGPGTAGQRTYMVHADHLGRPVRLTDEAAATVWQASYDPFGLPLRITSMVEQNLRFPGQYFLLETGLAYNWHRFYDPATGRYTQPDPLRFVDGPSVYAYAGGNPLMRVDPKGNQTLPIAVPLPIVLPISPSPDRDERDKFGLRVCRTPPQDPDGDCTPWMKKNMQSEVEFYCLQPRSCSLDMNKQSLGQRMFVNEMCARARDSINRVCYRGGDAGHRGAAGDAWVSFARCQAFYSVK